MRCALSRLLAGAVLLAAGSFPLLAAPALPRTGHPQNGDDPISITSWVAQLRLDAETHSSSAPRSVQEAVSRILPDVPGSPRCLSPLLIEASRQAPLSPAFAAAIAPLLSPPMPAREIQFLSRDGAFLIHYTTDRTGGDAVLATDRDGNGVPDYVDSVASSLSASRAAVVTRLGFRAPNGGPLEVYLVNLGGRIDGYAVRGSATRAGFLVLDSRLLGNDSLLRASVAHQYAHAVLASYPPGVPIWWTEASAAWLEGVVVGSYTHYTDKIQTAVGLAASGLGGDDLRASPGKLLWPLYLSELGSGAGVVREIWEQLDRQADTMDVWLATDQALAIAGSSLERAFSDFSLWLLLSGERSDGRHFAFADRLEGVSFAAEYEDLSAAQVQLAPAVAPLGVSFVRLVADAAGGGLLLRVEGDSPGVFQAQLLLTPRRTGAPLVRAPIELDAHGRGSIGIPWATYSEAVLIVGNVARGPQSQTPAGFALVANPDPDFPFQMSSFRADPDADQVRLSWETRAENGLSGWIVLRAERAGGPANRVNEFLIPAIGDGDGPVSYEYLDDGVSPGRSYFYSLVGVTHEGLTREIPETRVDLPR